MLRDLITDRQVQLIERLQPLSDWQGVGIQSIALSRQSVSSRELEALGAALGASCQYLVVSGLSGEEAQEEARQGIPKWFPHVGDNYKFE
jgi:hypothetical protein